MKDVLNVSYWLLERGLIWPNLWDGNRIASHGFCFPWFLGLDLVDGSFSEGKRLYMDITKVFALMNCNCCVEADNSSILYSFSGMGAPVLVWAIKIFSEIMEYTLGGKKGGWISRIDSPGRCKQYYFPLSKMIEKAWKSEFTSKKRRFSRFDERMLPGNIVRFYRVF